MNKEEITVMLQKGGWSQRLGTLYKQKGSRVACVSFTKEHVHLFGLTEGKVKATVFASVELKDVTLGADKKMYFGKYKFGGEI